MKQGEEDYEPKAEARSKKPQRRECAAEIARAGAVAIFGFAVEEERGRKKEERGWKGNTVLKGGAC
jgi:hypothetical protein